MGTVGFTGRSVVARPRDPSLGASEDAPTPVEPAVVRLQPGPRCRRIARVEAEVGGETLEGEALLVDEVAGLGGRSVGEEGANLRPGDLRFPAVAGEISSCVGHLPSEVRIAGWRQIIEDPQR